jgi:hypothetical protein
MTRALRENAGAKLRKPIRSYFDAAMFLRDAGSHYRGLGPTLAHNTVLHSPEHGVIAVRLYNTDIVTLYADGRVKLNNGGHQTVTTKARMNEILHPMGIGIGQARGEWYVSEIGSSAKPIEYFNGMEIHVEKPAHWTGEKWESHVTLPNPSKSVVCQACGGAVRVPRVPVRNTGMLRCECGALVPYTAKGRKAVKRNPPEKYIVRTPKLLAQLEAKYAWPGGYPVYAIMQDGETMCAACATENENLILVADRDDDEQWQLADVEVNWEDALACVQCGKMIETAYGVRDVGGEA